MPNKTELKEGDKFKLEGTVVRDTIIRTYSRSGNSDCIFPPSRWRKFLFGVHTFLSSIRQALSKKITFTMIKDENGKGWLVIGAVDEE